MSRDEIQKAKLGLEIELRGQVAKGQDLVKQLEACKFRITELRGGIAALDAVLKDHTESNGKIDELQLAGAPD